MSSGSSKMWSFAVALATCATAATAWQAGCSSGNESTSNGGGTGILGQNPGADGTGTGKIGLALTLPGGDLINSFTYTLTNSSGALITLPSPNPGTVSAANSA